MRRTLPTLFALTTLAGPLLGAPPRPFSVPAPRTYSGVLPCADCEGIRTTLDLFPDGSFVSKAEYLGKGGSAVDLGRWKAAENGNLVLRGGGADPVLYWPAANGTLRRLDRSGKEIRTEANLELRPEAAFRLVEDPFAFSGLFRSQGESARVKLCSTGQELPVQGSGGVAALEQESVARRSNPDAPVLARGTARLVRLPGTDPKAVHLAVVVEKVDQVSPEGLCPPLPGGDDGAADGRSAENRTWKVVTLSGQAVEGPDSRRSAHLELDRSRREVRGHTGCNRLRGRYELDGDEIQLSALATTRKACPEAGDLEQRLLKALEGVTRLKVSGDRLTLYAGKKAVMELREADLD